MRLVFGKLSEHRFFSAQMRIAGEEFDEETFFRSGQRIMAGEECHHQS